MKKFFAVILIALVSILFSGCSPAQKVTTLTFSIGETVLVVTPDYEKRELEVSYSDKEAEASQGAVAGEYFDRFDDVVEWLYKKEIVSNEKGTVKISTVSSEGAKEVMIDWNDNVKGIDYAQAFYTDLTNLFSEDIY